MAQRGLAPGALFGRYRVVRFLETTPTGACYEAELVADGSRVVLKVGKQHSQVFEAEQQIAMALCHPNVQRGLDAGEVDGRRYLALERVDGPTYADLLDALRERGEPMPVTTAMWIAHRMLLALRHVHGAQGADGKPLGIMHRTITPRCVLLSRAGEVKLGGFAGAMMAGLDGRSTAAMLAADLAYVAPEQLTGQDADERADLFSTALVLYEAVSGVAAGERTAQGKLLDQILGSSLPAPAELPLATGQELSDLVMQGLAREPGERFCSAEAFANALATLLASRCGEDLEAWSVQLGRLVEKVAGPEARSTGAPTTPRAVKPALARTPDPRSPPTIEPRSPPTIEPRSPPKIEPRAVDPPAPRRVDPPAPRIEPPVPRAVEPAVRSTPSYPEPAAVVSPKTVPHPIQAYTRDPAPGPLIDPGTFPDPVQPGKTDPDGGPGPLLGASTIADSTPPDMTAAPVSNRGTDEEPSGDEYPHTAAYGVMRPRPPTVGGARGREPLQPSITAETELLAIDEETRASLAAAAGPVVLVDPAALPTIRTEAVTGPPGAADPAALSTIRTTADGVHEPAADTPEAPPPRTLMLAIDDAGPVQPRTPTEHPPQPTAPFPDARTEMLAIDEASARRSGSVEGKLELQVGASAAVEQLRPVATAGSQTEMVRSAAEDEAAFRGWFPWPPTRTTLLLVAAATTIGLGGGAFARLLGRARQITFQTGQIVDHAGWQLGLEDAGEHRDHVQVVLRVRHPRLTRSPSLAMVQGGTVVPPRVIDIGDGEQPGEAVWRCLYPAPPRPAKRLTLRFTPADGAPLLLSIPLR